jgi:hypothetical protein
MLTCLEGKVYVDFIDLTKEEILKYDYQQLNKKVIFNLKIISHVKKEPEQKKEELQSSSCYNQLPQRSAVN